jgi:hypothetical protein
MDRPTLVSGFVETCLRHSSVRKTVTRATNISTGRTPSATPIRRVEFSRLEALRRSYNLQGFSQQAIELFVAGSRSNTNSAYESAWSSWFNWCVERNIDPLRSDLAVMSDYLARLHASGKSYSSINLHRPMLSTTLPSIEGIPVVQHPLVIKLSTSNPPLKCTKSMDPTFFSHSAMGPKNLKFFRLIQFSTPDSPVFATFKYSLPFGRYLMLKFGFFKF